MMTVQLLTLGVVVVVVPAAAAIHWCVCMDVQVAAAKGPNAAANIVCHSVWYRDTKG
jgi:hypothetical protein